MWSVRTAAEFYLFCTHEGTGPCDLSLPVVPWGVYTKALDLSHEQFTRSVLRYNSQGLVPKIQTSLNSWDLSQGLNFGLYALNFVPKMASSYDGPSSRLQVFAGTSRRDQSRRMCRPWWWAKLNTRQTVGKNRIWIPRPLLEKRLKGESF